MQVNGEENWGRKHWGSIVTNYAKAPYFDDYATDMQSILNHEWQNLCELDMAIIQWLMDILEINVPIVYQSKLENLQGCKSDLLVNICKNLGGIHYLSGQGAKAYMDLKAFEDAGLQVIWQEFVAPIYPQMFPEIGFLESMSMIDTLFCWGKESQQYLRSLPSTKSSAPSSILPESVFSHSLPLTNLAGIERHV
jgi:hypothetical protein